MNFPPAVKADLTLVCFFFFLAFFVPPFFFQPSRRHKRLRPRRARVYLKQRVYDTTS